MGNPMEEYLRRYPPPSQPEAERDSAPMGPPIPAERRPAEATVDLHGCTVEEGRARLDQFIKASIQAGRSKVLIVHGKGVTPGSDSPLRRMVRDYLEQNPYVGKTGIPGSNEGGRGATWAVIRQRSR
jgi:DNA-nicking Smr family endonuclease